METSKVYEFSKRNPTTWVETESGFFCVEGGMLIETDEDSALKETSAAALERSPDLPGDPVAREGSVSFVVALDVNQAKGDVGIALGLLTAGLQVLGQLLPGRFTLTGITVPEEEK